MKYIYIKGPEGREPALGEKNPRIVQKNLESHVDMSFAATNKTTKVFAQQARGSRDFFERNFVT